MAQAMRSTDSDDSDDGSTKRLDSVAVQVFTVPTVVEALLNPKRLNLGESTTIIDRALCTVLYGMALIADNERSGPPDLLPMSPSEDILAKLGTYGYEPPMLKLQINDSKKINALVPAIYHLKYILSASPVAMNFFMTFASSALTVAPTPHV